MATPHGLRLEHKDAPADAAEVTPETLAMEANHRIANHLAAVVGLMRLHAAGVTSGRRTMTTEEVRLLLLEIAGRIDTVGQLHKLLAQRPRDAVVNLGDFLREVCAIAVSSLSLTGETSLNYDCSPGCSVPPQQVVPLALIINELVTNAVKYAHPSGVPSRVEVNCHQQAGNGGVLVEVADDGVGLPEGFDPAVDGGLGLRVVRALSEQLGATLSYDSNELGLSARLLVPSPARRMELNGHQTVPQAGPPTQPAA
jgi:two-component sensor histidine kinase